MRVEDALGKGSPDRLGELRAAIEESGRTSRAADALAHQETLDARILAALGRLDGGDLARDDEGPMRFGRS